MADVYRAREIERVCSRILALASNPTERCEAEDLVAIVRALDRTATAAVRAEATAAALITELQNQLAGRADLRPVVAVLAHEITINTYPLAAGRYQLEAECRCGWYSQWAASRYVAERHGEAHMAAVMPRPLGPGEGDEEVWIPPASDCLTFRFDLPCPHCGSTHWHARTRRCAECGRRP